MIRINLCETCQAIVTRKDDCLLLAHDIQTVILHRRTRKARGGVEVQWSTDWKWEER